MKVKASLIRNNPNNPRVIKDDKFKKLVQSLKDFPEMAEVREVVINKDNIVLGGNMRFKAMIEAGWTDVPVKIVDWSEDKQKEFIIKDNVSGGEWDWDTLANEWDMDELDDWGLDIPADLEPEVEVEEDDAPEVDETTPPVSVLGEVYQLGRHRVMCGSATEAGDVAVLMDGNKADFVHTDPPYGLGKKMSGGTWATKASHYSDMHEWDKEAEQAFFDVSVSQGCDAVVWGGNYFQTPPSRGWLIWKKPYFPTMADCEIAYTTKDMNARVFESKRSDAHKEHKTQKPLEVVLWAFSYMDGQVVLDLFGGSGSTLIACEQTDRTCYMMELDPKYVDVIRKRYWKFINNGEEDGWEQNTPAIQEVAQVI
jgi:DNA modification methylase